MYLARIIISPPLPSPKSYHSSLWISTLKNASFSVLKEDLYQTLFPRYITGSYPNLAKKSTSLMLFVSCMFMADLIFVDLLLLPHRTKNHFMPKTEKTVSSDDNSFYQSMHKYTISPFASFCVDAWKIRT